MEVNRTGHKLAMRGTKGRHAFIVTTHTTDSTFITAPPPSTTPENSETFGAPALPSDGSPTGCP